MKCENCSTDVNSIVMHKSAIWCWSCHNASKGEDFGQAANVIADSIPGGVEIKHGICNEDGTPRRYYSKSEMRDAAFAAGFIQGDDTPRTNHKLQEERAAQRESR